MTSYFFGKQTSNGAFGINPPVKIIQWVNSDEEQSSPLVSKNSAKLGISASYKSEASSSSDPENLSLKRLQISSRFTKQPVIKKPVILKSDSVSAILLNLFPVNTKRRSLRILASSNKKGPLNSVTVIESNKKKVFLNAKNASSPQIPAVSPRYTTSAVILLFFIFIFFIMFQI